MITAKELSKKYARTTAVDQISFEAPEMDGREVVIDAAALRLGAYRAPWLDALLDAHWIPRHVVIHERTAELEVQAL